MRTQAELVVSGTPAVQRLGSAVILQGPALLEVLSLVIIGARERSRRDGLATPGRVQHLISELALAAGAASDVSQPGHADVRDPAVSVDSVDMGCTQAAELLDLSPRQVRRLASSIGAHKVGGALVFDRSVVIAYAALRREEQDT